MYHKEGVNWELHTQPFTVGWFYSDRGMVMYKSIELKENHYNRLVIRTANFKLDKFLQTD